MNENADAEYRPNEHGTHSVYVAGEEYGAFGEEGNARAAADWWARYLAAGGHPLTEDEKKLGRRDTRMPNGVTFREHLGGPARTPDFWEVFQGGVRVGQYRTARGAMRRAEILKKA